MRKLKAWWHLFRPWSYTATLVPFLVGLALARVIDSDASRWSLYTLTRWGLGLVAGFLFQATVNLLNTWGDERSGVDSAPGAIRTTPQVHEGLISLPQVLAAAVMCASLAVSIGVYLCFYDYPPGHGITELPSKGFCFSLLAAGVLGALGSVNYSTGITFKYYGLGVLFVSWLMGPLEIFVAFSIVIPEIADTLVWEWLRLPASPAHAWLAFIGLPLVFLAVTMPVALLVGVIMHGNDMRDIFSDRAAHIRTFASVLGPRRALWYYGFCHLLAHAWVVVLAILACAKCHAWGVLWLFLPLVVLPLSLRTLKAAIQVHRQNPAQPPWRGLERASGAIHLLFGILYALAIRLAAI